MGTRKVKISELTPDVKNANRGTERGDGMLEDSLRKYGAGRSILLDKHGRIIAGNKTAQKAGEIGLDEVLVVETDGTQVVAVQRTDLDLDEPAARELAFADNRIGQVDLEWDAEEIAAALNEGIDLMQFWRQEEIDALMMAASTEGTSDESLSSEQAHLTLAERFGVPPFSVLDARQGYWQKRKAAWIALGIQSELGRGGGLTMAAEQVTTEGLNYYRHKGGATPGGSPRPACDYSKRQRGDGHGRALNG